MIDDPRRRGRDDDARLNGLAHRLDKPMGVLGLLFLLLVLAQAFVHDEPLSTVLTITSWILWAVFAAAIRGSRSAGRLLTDRLAWLAAVTVAVILAAGQLLMVSDSCRSLPRALHDAALTTITGEPLRAGDTFAQILELVRAAYSVAVFGTLAGALGAFYLSREWAEDERGQPDE
ncbi:hypothetical protein [Micromonospora sp. NBC_01638]|uniref:hypothetical protein n=1 Tax=Micromonospora sp. NBC_01638 TaxID=2975982 RepID=UPI0038640CC5|nr:hypothetical protein OG811_31265 [Micromonospora sp. NBC_01638]